MAVYHLTTEAFQKIYESDKPVLVDFWASWCGPCRMMAPILEEADRALGGKALICKVDVDAEPDLAAEFSITSIPTLLVFKNGEVTDRAVGVQPLDRLLKMLAE